MRWIQGDRCGAQRWCVRAAIGPLVACLLVVGAGCSHVSRDELSTDLDAVRAELRAEQQDSEDRLAGRIDDVEQRLGGRIDELELSQAELAERMARLEVAYAELESQFGIAVQQLEKAILFNVPVHFDFDSSTLAYSETSTLDGFAAFYDEYFRGDLITVEGFTDESGSEAYNHRLGKRRAEEVKSYLSEVAGLDPEVLRTISYGESYARLVAPGEYGHDAGRENRRVVLVIDQSARASSSSVTAPADEGATAEKGNEGIG